MFKPGDINFIEKTLKYEHSGRYFEQCPKYLVV